MTHQAGWIDELEADLGLGARLRLIANVGGQRRRIPKMPFAGNSTLAGEIGSDAARWLAARFGGTDIEFPSRRGAEMQRAGSLLLADILEAGLDMPSATANQIAQKHGVSRRWVHKQRNMLRKSGGPAPLPLFDHPHK